MTNTASTSPTYGARDFDPAACYLQIGRPNVLAISGGRVEPVTQGSRTIGLRLPVRYGYRVDVLLADDDTYTVRRVHVRSGRETVKGEVTGVYAEQLGDTAYRASCYHDAFGGQA